MRRARRPARLLLAVAAAAGGATGPETASAQVTPALTVHQHDRAVTVDAELPGTLRALAPACGRGGRCRGVWLLLRPLGAADGDTGGSDAAPLRLLLFDPARAAGGDSAGALADAPVKLPAETDALALADLDGDGVSELLAGAPGRVWSLGDPASPGPAHLLLDDPSVDLAAAQALLDPTLPLLPSPAVGGLRWYRPAEGGVLELAGSAPLPVRTRRRAHGLELSSPRPALLPAAAGAPRRWAAGPEPHGDRRLRSILIDPLSTDGAGAESWSMLPSPESVESARYVLLDGRPALAVFTHAADRLGIFDQARLRLFRLGADRTRAGSGPILAADTTSHRWQRAAVTVADLDGDGRDDVSIAQVKGLGGEAVLIETYRGLPGSRFDHRPKKLRLDLPDASWRWPPTPTPDLDADDLPDLIALSNGRLLVYTTTDRRPGTPLPETPTWEIPWDHPEGGAEHREVDDQEQAREDENGEDAEQAEGDEDSRPLALDRFPATLDLDGDHRPEILHLTPLANGRDRLRVILLR